MIMDSKAEVRRNWSMFDRCYSGLLKNRHIGKKVIFVTLTSSPVSVVGLNDDEKLELLKHNFDALRKRYEKEFKCSFGSFFRVSTLEGSGVLHILLSNEWLERDWLVENWNQLHGSHIIDVRSLNSDCWRSAKYVISQYVAGQIGKKIFGYSKDWVYVGFTKDLLEAKRASRDFSVDRFNDFGVRYFPVRYNYFRVLWDLFLYYRVVNNEQSVFWRLSDQVNAILQGNNVLMTTSKGVDCYRN